MGSASTRREAGRVLVPWAVGGFLAGFATVRLAGVMGHRGLVVGGLLASLSFAGLAAFHTHPWQTCVAVSILGVAPARSSRAWPWCWLRLFPHTRQLSPRASTPISERSEERWAPLRSRP